MLNLEEVPTDPGCAGESISLSWPWERFNIHPEQLGNVRDGGLGILTDMTQTPDITPEDNGQMYNDRCRNSLCHGYRIKKNKCRMPLNMILTFINKHILSHMFLSVFSLANYKLVNSKKGSLLLHS